MLLFSRHSPKLAASPLRAANLFQELGQVSTAGIGVWGHVPSTRDQSKRMKARAVSGCERAAALPGIAIRG